MRCAGAVLALMALGAAPGWAQLGGWVDTWGCSTLGGWAWNSAEPDTPITVDLYEDGVYIETVTAGNFRQDLLNAGIGNGVHGFQINTPGKLLDGLWHQVNFAYGGTMTWVSNAHQALMCSGSTPGATQMGYTYYSSDTFSSINTSNWTVNGSVSGGWAGLTSTSNGSLISTVPVQGPSTAFYEVRTILNLTASGGTYINYLRATPDANFLTATGSAFALVLNNVTVSGSSCTATFSEYSMVNGAATLLSSMPVVCNQRSEFRSVMTEISTTPGTAQVESYLNGVQLVGYQPSSSQINAAGQPGVGVANVPIRNGVIEADLGPWDNVPPNPVAASSVAVSAFPNRIDISFAGTTDNPGGSGVLEYSFFRDGQWIGNS